MKFSILDDNYKEHEVSTGEDGNECYDVGQSSTQSTQVHLLNYKGAEVRIIDTPGIGDTRYTMNKLLLRVVYYATKP